MAKSLVGKKVVIVSDNENYEKYRGRTLVCTYSSNSGIAYDSTMYPQHLCDFKLLNGDEFPFALYEYEFKALN